MGQRTTGLRWLARVLHKRRRITKSSKNKEPKKDSKKQKTKQKKSQFPRSLSQKSPSPSCPPPIPPSPSHSSQSCPLPLPLPTPNHQLNREKEEDKRSNPNPEPVDKYPIPEPMKPMGEDPNDDQVPPMRKAFNSLDTNRDGKISPSELGILMRSLGGNPTQAQIKSIIAEEKLTSAFDYNRCGELMEKHMKPEEFDRQLRDAFKLMDKEGSGFVSVSSLRHILTHIGEKLEPSEFDEWVRDIDVGSDGKMRYEDFIARLVSN